MTRFNLGFIFKAPRYREEVSVLPIPLSGPALTSSSAREVLIRPAWELLVPRQTRRKKGGCGMLPFSAFEQLYLKTQRGERWHWRRGREREGVASDRGGASERARAQGRARERWRWREIERSKEKKDRLVTRKCMHALMHSYIHVYI